MAGVRGYLLALAAVSLLTALALALTPKGSVRRIQAVTCGILAALVCLLPLGNLDGEDIAQTLSRLQMEAETARTGIEVKNRELVTMLIKDNTETYIWDKAQAMGLDLKVEAEMAGEDTYPYPCAVTLTGPATPAQKQELGRYIAENLAIAEEAQTWKP